MVRRDGVCELSQLDAVSEGILAYECVVEMFPRNRLIDSSLSKWLEPSFSYCIREFFPEELSVDCEL